MEKANASNSSKKPIISKVKSENISSSSSSSKSTKIEPIDKKSNVKPHSPITKKDNNVAFLPTNTKDSPKKKQNNANPLINSSSSLKRRRVVFENKDEETFSPPVSPNEESGELFGLHILKNKDGNSKKKDFDTINQGSRSGKTINSGGLFDSNMSSSEQTDNNSSSNFKKGYNATLSVKRKILKNGGQKEVYSKEGLTIVKFSNDDIKIDVGKDSSNNNRIFNDSILFKDQYKKIRANGVKYEKALYESPSSNIKTIYYYAIADTRQYTFSHNNESMFVFPNKQIEYHYANGRKEIIFPDGTKKAL